VPRGTSFGRYQLVTLPTQSIVVFWQINKIKTFKTMATLSVPLTKELEEFIESQVKLGKSENKASVVRRALRRLAEEEAIMLALRAEQEPTLCGDLDKLAQKLG
jgi:putative addiction module CopG family antidote